MSKSFNIEQLSTKLNNIDKTLKDIERDELIKKYGTFLDSKKDTSYNYICCFCFLVLIWKLYVDYLKLGLKRRPS